MVSACNGNYIRSFQRVIWSGNILWFTRNSERSNYSTTLGMIKLLDVSLVAYQCKRSFDFLCDYAETFPNVHFCSLWFIDFFFWPFKNVFFPYKRSLQTMDIYPPSNTNKPLTFFLQFKVYLPKWCLLKFGALVLKIHLMPHFPILAHKFQIY
jgi:hypothetical protein